MFNVIRGIKNRLLYLLDIDSYSESDRISIKKFKKYYPSVNDSFAMWKPYSLYVHGSKSSVSIGENVFFRSFCNILVFSGGELVIHNNVFFNNYCSINCLSKITVGEGSIFGENVKIYDHNHVYSVDAGIVNVERNSFKLGFVHIGTKCWIGSNVTILPNVIIGDNVIIGANNLIYKSVPANTIIKAKLELVTQSYGSES